MIQYSIVTEQPDNEPVTLDEAKTHLEYTGDAKNSYIETLITTCRRLCEAYSGLSLVTQVRRVKIDYFPCKEIILPYGPVQSIESFTYLKSDGTTATLVEETDFRMDTHSRVARVFPISGGQITSWPGDVANSLGAIQIDYQTGFDNVSGEMTPSEVKTAILMYVAYLFENRGDDQGRRISDALPWECMMILDAIKVNWNANID